MLRLGTRAGAAARYQRYWQFNRGYVSGSPVTTTEITRDAMTPLGFSVRDAVEALAGLHRATPNYVDETTTELSIQITETGTQLLSDYSSPYLYKEWEPNGSIDLRGDIDFTTADGYFTERLEGRRLAIREGIKGELWFDLYVSSLKGQYRFPTLDRGTASIGELTIQAHLTENGGTTGEALLLEAERYYEGPALAGTW